ncbi:MAG TPA: universal stress protein [Micromonosporaceae bacterium]|nr:universal stress protein [Micromonosporaceae bacterium]
MAETAAAVPGPVLIGFDGTPSGEDALTLGQLCSRVLEVPIVVATVHPAPAAIGNARVDAEWVADRRRVAEQILDRARGSIGGEPTGVEFRSVASSSAAHGLHDLAEELAASVIVVGSRSKAPEQQLFAGSTADRLLSGSVCPVAVAPAGMRERPAPDVTRVGVAYLDTRDAVAALDVASRLAARTAAELRLYTVVAAPAEVVMPVIGVDAEQAFTATAREAYQAVLDSAIAAMPAACNATGHLLTGDVVEKLADLDTDDIDVLFCGSRGYGPARRVLLGGVSSRLVRRARSPVVIVPRGD